MSIPILFITDIVLVVAACTLARRLSQKSDRHEVAVVAGIVLGGPVIAVLIDGLVSGDLGGVFSRYFLSSAVTPLFLCQFLFGVVAQCSLRFLNYRK